MPELPEVETVRLQLLHKVKGKTVAQVKVFHLKSTGHDTTFAAKLKHKTFGHIDRVGKLLIFHFAEEGNVFMLTHLRMTGQFFYVDQTGVSGGGHSLRPTDAKNLPNSHTRVAFYFTDHSTLFFNDMRLFGYTKLATAAEVTLARSKFGPEPIMDDFDLPSFTASLKKRHTSIKAALLDQSLIAGLGNIYVDETLFASKVHPMRLCSTLTKKEITALVLHGGAIMKHAISVGGTTFQHFADTSGERGNFTDYLKVFGKQNTACPVCQNMIIKTKVAGRGTHYCATCQK